MARPLRIDIEDGWHHVMNRGADHRAAFLDDSDRIELGTRLGDMYERFGVETHAYCLMTTHYHLLLHCPNGGLSDAMQRLGSIYTRHLNDRVGRDGALFRGRFHSRLVVSDAHLVAAARYIHRNALDLPGVDRVERYRWSSHRAYLGHRAAPPWLRTDVVLGHFGNDTTAFAFVLDTPHISEAWMKAAFRFPSRNALRSAVSRVRNRVATDPVFGAAVERTAALVFRTRLQQGSDPRCNQRAARAAS